MQIKKDNYNSNNDKGNNIDNNNDIDNKGSNTDDNNDNKIHIQMSTENMRSQIL